jgi:hypothetical protein
MSTASHKFTVDVKCLLKYLRCCRHRKVWYSRGWQRLGETLRITSEACGVVDLYALYNLHLK